MKTLYLIRHAKSSWSNASLSDFDRTLNERGKQDAVTMGQRLKNQNIMPNCIISSSAKRTKKTSERISKVLGFNFADVEFKQELYHSSHLTLMRSLNNIKEKNDSVFIIAHNPGVSNFCDYLTHHTIDFPTTGVAKITFEVDSWMEITSGSGILEWFDYPKNANAQ